MSTTKQPVIAIAFYSTYGHIAQLAEAVIKGVESTGAIVKPYQFQEILSEEILTKMHAGASLKPKYPILKPDDLKEVDGWIIGAPTRYGRMPAQVSSFFDACGGLWQTGALTGKFVTVFTSVAGQHGGHETTALTTMPFFVHQGMCYVPIGYSTPLLFDISAVQGGAPYGASTVAGGDGSGQPTKSDIDIAEYQGKYFSSFVGTYVRGKHNAGASMRSNDVATTITAAASTTATTAATQSAAKQVPDWIEPKAEGYTLAPPLDITNLTNPPKPYQVTTNYPNQDVPNPDIPTAPAALTGPKKSASTPAYQALAPPRQTSSRQEGGSARKQKAKGGILGCCNGSGIDD